MTGLGVMLAALALSPPAFAQVRTRVSAPEVPKAVPPAFVVAPFQNSSKLANLEWMRIGLPLALAEKLETHPDLRPVAGVLLVPAGAGPASLDAAGVVAWPGARTATLVFTGSFARTDWKLELRVTLWRIEGQGDARTAKSVGAWTKVDDFGQTLAMLDAAAFELLGKAGQAVPQAAKAAFSRPATADFYAFTLYGRGAYALHGLGSKASLEVAAKNLERSVFIDPKFAEAHYLLAVLYATQKQVARARGRFSYALDLRAGYYAPIAALARAAAVAKERDEAVDLAVRALGLRPWDLDMRLLLGELLWEDGDVDGAEVELSRVVKMDPDQLPARRLLVLVHATKGQGEELAHELEIIVRLDPKDQAAKLDLGAAYAALGRDEDAIRVYESVVNDNPKQLQALKFLGDIYKNRGDLAAAIAWYEKALSANKSDPRPYFLLGAAYVEAGLLKKAIRIYQLAQQFPKYLADAEANLGAIYLSMGNDPQAMWYLKRAATKRPADAKVHFNYGLVLARAKKYDEALGAFAHAAELDPKDADVRFAQGVVFLRMGKIEEAEKAFKACLEIDPDDEDCRHNLKLIDDLRRRAKEGEVKIE